ncbi:MAG: WD40 repeat domain-containing protein, partial [Acidimicrobiia bacterium]|nr:WD40 repeat domain-containing protein [Acidimicrobiia bacterium]
TGLVRGFAVGNAPGPEQPQRAFPSDFEIAGDHAAIAVPDTQQVQVYSREGRLVRTRSNGPTELALFEDGTLVTGDASGTLTIASVDLSTGTTTIVLGAPILDLAPGPADSVWVRTADGSGSDYRLIRLSDGSVRATLSGSGAGSAGVVASSHDRSTLAIGTISGAVDVYDVDTGAVTTVQVSGPPSHLAFAPDDTRLFVLDGLGAISVVDLEAMETVFGSEAHAGAAHLAFDPNGRWAATGGDDGVVRLWDASSGDLLSTLRRGQTAVHALWFEPDGSHIGFVDEFGTVDSLTTDLAELVAEALSLLPEGRAFTPAECRRYFGSEECR